MSNALKQCRQLFAAIFEPEDVIEFRTLKQVAKRWTRADDIAGVIEEFERFNNAGRHCYFGANPRTGDGGSTAEAVALARCVYADFDGNTTADEASERIAAAGLPEPTATVFTGGGIHAWWRLDQPIADARQHGLMLKRLAAALSSDEAGTSGWPRIMRLPGLVNHKYAHKPLAKLLECDASRRYSLERLSPKSRGMSHTSREFLDHGTVAACRGRRETMFAVACDLRDRGWNTADAEAAIMPRMRQFDLSPEDLADCPRQIRNAWKREPRAIAVAAAPPPPPPAAAFEPFPTHELPEPLAAFVRETAATIFTDESRIALPLLAVLGSAVGTTRRLTLKRGWDAPAMLWTVVVGESGTQKSPALDAVLEHLHAREAELRREHAAAMDEHEAEAAVYEAAHAAWKRQAASGKADEEPPAKPAIPAARRCLVADATVESLAPILADNPRGLLLARDELAGWFGGMDRYSGKAGAADEPFFLSTYNGSPHTVDRKTGRQSIYVPQAALSITGCIQPGVLRACIGDRQRASGLLARILLAAPPRRPRRWSEAEVSPLVREQLRQVIDRLFELEGDIDELGRLQPRLVRLSQDAKRLWIEHFESHDHESADLAGDDAAAWSKLEEQPARLALIFHLVKVAAHDPFSGDPEPIADEVAGETMAAAIRLVAWFKAETRRVYAMLDESAANESARREDERLAGWIERRGGRVATRDLIAGCRGIDNADDAEAALNRLEAAGVGRWQTTPPTDRGGRPGTVFVLTRQRVSAEPTESQQKPSSACADSSGEPEFVEI
jgi:hypothetical protein